MVRKGLVSLIILTMLLSMLAVGNAAGYEDQVTFSVASLMVTPGADFEDAMYQKLNEMFNFKMEVVPLNWDDYTTKPRIWLASGDTPDCYLWDFKFADYTNYVEQELLEPLPADYEEKYPNLASAMEKTSLTQFLKDKFDGQIYCVPHLAYMNPPTNPVLAHHILYYRKDWAEKCGIEIGETITLDQMFDIAKTFQAMDPGANGEGNTIGVVTRSTFINDLILGSFNKEFRNFYYDGTGFKWGPADEGTYEGLAYFKDVYDKGLIDPEYYIYSGKEFYDKFFAGKAGLMYGEGHGNEQNQVLTSFQTTNPTLKAQEVVGSTVVLANDGKWRGTEQTNFWLCSLFKKGLDPVVMDRILSIMDYLCTDEGYAFVRMGVEGTDYSYASDGTLTINRPKDPASGIAIDIMDVYPSQRVWVFMSILDDQWGIDNPELPLETRQNVVNQFKLKEANGDVCYIDWDIKLFSGPVFDKFDSQMDTEIPGLITKSGDLRNNWEEWVSEKKALVDSVLAELANGIQK